MEASCSDGSPSPLHCELLAFLASAFSLYTSPRNTLGARIRRLKRSRIGELKPTFSAASWRRLVEFLRSGSAGHTAFQPRNPDERDTSHAVAPQNPDSPPKSCDVRRNIEPSLPKFRILKGLDVCQIPLPPPLRSRTSIES
jgi:hypothetical protein